MGEYRWMVYVGPHECKYGTYTWIYTHIYTYTDILVSARGHSSIEWDLHPVANPLATTSMNNTLSHGADL